MQACHHVVLRGLWHLTGAHALTSPPPIQSTAPAYPVFLTCATYLHVTPFHLHIMPSCLLDGMFAHIEGETMGNGTAVIACISQKGGTGKTTVAVSLAVEATRTGSAAVIDLDPQGSASAWAGQRAATMPLVIPGQAKTLDATLAKAVEMDVPYVFVDTAPHSETSALTAARCADLILIPCRPGLYDMRAVMSTAAICQSVGKTGIVVLTHVPARGTLAHDADEGLRSVGLVVCPVFLGQRVAFVHAADRGMAVSEMGKNKAAVEMSALYEWMLSTLATRETS